MEGEGEMPIDEPVQPVQPVAQDVASTDAIMDAIALPDASNNGFLALNDEADSNVQSLPRPDREEVAHEAEAAVHEVSLGPVYATILNEGNFIEIGVTLEAGQANGETAQMLRAILAISDNAVFHATRVSIYQPLRGGQSDSPDGIAAAVQQSKEAILSIPGVPQGVTADMIQWDAVSYKVPISGVEFLCNKNAIAQQRLTPRDIQLIEEMERMLISTITEKCSEFRQRTQTTEDEFLPDMTLYLEAQIAGGEDPDRDVKVAKVGKGTLFNYIDQMQSVFLTGNLPSSLQPAKIYAAHDIISAGEIRGSIQRLAEIQVIQQSQVTSKNPNVTKRAVLGALGADQKFLGDSANWTQQQRASMITKSNIDTYQRLAMKTFGEKYDQPMSRLENQLAGSSNKLFDQVEAATGEAVTQMNETQEELAKHQLSVLLACLRTRFNATQQSDWELVTDDDLDHLEIVKQLAHSLQAVAVDRDNLFRKAMQLQVQVTQGHNITKFRGANLPEELLRLLNYTIEGRAKILAKQVPLLETDLREGGQIFQQLLRGIVMSATQKQRIKMEFNERLTRRRAQSVAGQQ